MLSPSSNTYIDHGVLVNGKVDFTVSTEFQGILQGDAVSSCFVAACSTRPSKTRGSLTETVAASPSVANPQFMGRKAYPRRIKVRAAVLNMLGMVFRVVCIRLNTSANPTRAKRDEQESGEDEEVRVRSKNNSSSNDENEPIKTTTE